MLFGAVGLSLGRDRGKEHEHDTTLVIFIHLDAHPPKVKLLFCSGSLEHIFGYILRFIHMSMTFYLCCA